jgi:ABC-type multidrug transport system ATPase subunit
VQIDGVDVRDMSFDALTAAVGVVSQETYLFHASVAENLRFAKPDATDAELVMAAKVAQIHEHLEALPDGYDTVVGERGYRFSGGEKQRLAIARAVLRDPPVLVLDEATSALDTQTEQAVQEAIDAASAGRTTITIAHRLSTIRDADEIIVLDQGEIAERGRHDELLALGGRYAALVNRDADLVEAALEGTMITGTGERRARLTATEPTRRCAACDELPTTITTLSSGCSSRRVVAAPSSWSVMTPWPRSNRQRSSRPSSCAPAEARRSRSTSSKLASISATALADSMSMAGTCATYTTSMLPLRPCRRRIAASSARTDGGDPSYPTTRKMSPFGATGVFIGVNASGHRAPRP